MNLHNKPWPLIALLVVFWLGWMGLLVTLVVAAIRWLWSHA